MMPEREELEQIITQLIDGDQDPEEDEKKEDRK